MTSLQNVSKVFHFYFLDLVIYSHILKVKRNKREKQVSFPCPSTPALVHTAHCCATGLSWVTMYLGIAPGQHTTHFLRLLGCVAFHHKLCDYMVNRSPRDVQDVFTFL